MGVGGLTSIRLGGFLPLFPLIGWLMFFFDKLFGSGKIEQPAPAPTVSPVEKTATTSSSTAPRARLQYHPELIETFKQDHAKLLKLFSAIHTFAEHGDVKRTAEYLMDFRFALQGHLLTENVRLYVYLERQLGNDSSTYELIHSFRHEMDAIGKAVVHFLEQYRELETHPHLLQTFITDLDAIGKVLVKRIRNEEEILYPLYAPV